MKAQQHVFDLKNFNTLSYGCKLLLFWGGPIALHGLVPFLNTIGPSHTKVAYAYFDLSHMAEQIHQSFSH